MYMSFRQMSVDPARTMDAVQWLQWIAGRLNDEHGGNFAVSMNVGGDPSRVSLASPWADLAAYGATRASMAADEELTGVIRTIAGDLVHDAQDTIGRIMKAPGDRGAFALVNTAMMQMAAGPAAVAMAIEIAEHADRVTGTTTAVLTAQTGPRAGLMWLTPVESLGAIGEAWDKLGADEKYMSYPAKAADCFVQGSLEQSIWQLV